MDVVPLDVNFFHHGERHAIIALAKAGDFFGRSRFLVAKIVAWKAKDHEILSAMGLLQGLQLRVLGRESALGSGVHNEHALALEAFEVEGFSLEGVRLQVVEGRSLCGHGEADGKGGKCPCSFEEFHTFCNLFPGEFVHPLNPT